MSTESQLANAALKTLHGARGLPPVQAAAQLRDFLDSIGSHLDSSVRLGEASVALRDLIQSLEKNGAASNDDWQSAIETMLSFANETS